MIRRGEYDYFVHALTDGVLPIEADLLREAVEAFRPRLPSAFEAFLTAEAMGIPLATALTVDTGKPFLVARKRAYDLPGEVRVSYRTGYSEGHLHVHGLRPGQRVVIIDDVLSRAGTILALAQAVEASGATVAKVLVLANKGFDLADLAKRVGAPVEALVEVRVRDGAVQVEEGP